MDLASPIAADPQQRVAATHVTGALTPFTSAQPLMPADLLRSIAAAADPDALLAIPVVQALTGKGRSTIYGDVMHGRFPPPAIRSRRYSRWRAADVRRWLRGEWLPADQEGAA
jgi:predicted DNA-binding transcriptional regulator AlpA